MKSHRFLLSNPMRIAGLLSLAVFAALAYRVGSSMREFGRQRSLSINLYQAVTFQDIPKAKSLLDQGADPNSGDDGWLFLLRAIENKDKKMIRLLMAYGADPGLALQETRTPQQAEVLLRLGADVNARGDADQDTPLLAQATIANVEMVRFLLAHGADVHVKDEVSGQTLLERVRYAWGNHHERDKEYAATVELLKRAGAEK